MLSNNSISDISHFLSGKPEESPKHRTAIINGLLYHAIFNDVGSSISQVSTAYLTFYVHLSYADCRPNHPDSSDG